MLPKTVHMEMEDSDIHSPIGRNYGCKWQFLPQHKPSVFSDLNFDSRFTSSVDVPVTSLKLLSPKSNISTTPTMIQLEDSI